MEKLINYLKGEKVTSILDVGTGSGDFIEVLQDVFPNAKIMGVDPEIESLQEATKKYPGVSFNVMSAENLEFADNSFDVASISMALHHLPDIQTSLKEMQRIVKSGGWIIVNELFSDNLNPAQEVHKMFHHFRSKIDRLTGIYHQESFEKEQILHMVKEAGIRIQLSFENTIETNLIAGEGELEIKVDKMKQHLERIKNLPEYWIFKPEIEEFRARSLKHGFQPATRVVVVGKVQ